MINFNFENQETKLSIEQRARVNINQERSFKRALVFTSHSIFICHPYDSAVRNLEPRKT